MDPPQTPLQSRHQPIQPMMGEFTGLWGSARKQKEATTRKLLCPAQVVGAVLGTSFSSNWITVFQGTVCPPGEGAVHARALRACQGTVHARGWCACQGTVCLPGHCVHARALCACQGTVHAKALCACQGLVCMPGHCVLARGQCMPGVGVHARALCPPPGTPAVCPLAICPIWLAGVSRCRRLFLSARQM